MAEPKPAAEKPNLVAVASEPKAGTRSEAAAQPAAGAATQERPKPAPASGGAPAAQQAPREKKGTRWGLWLLALLLLGALATAWVQTQRLGQAEGRVTALSEQVLGLQAQLSAANTQIQTYEMQRGQVREAVSDLAQRILVLNELVGGAAPAAAAPAAEAEATPAP